MQVLFYLDYKTNEIEYSETVPHRFSDKMAKWYPANMQQIYRRTPKPAIQIYENHTYSWMFLCKFTAYLRNTSGGMLLNFEKYLCTVEIYG